VPSPISAGRRCQALSHASASTGPAPPAPAPRPPAPAPRRARRCRPRDASRGAGEITRQPQLQQVADVQPQRVLHLFAGLQARGHQGGLPAGGQRRRGGLVEGRGPVGVDAGQVGRDADFGPALHDAQAHPVGGLAPQLGREGRQGPELAGTPQGLGRGHALAREAQRAVGLQAALEAGVAAEHPCGGVGDREAALREVDPAAGSGQQRRARPHTHIVAAQRDAAAHGGTGGIGQGDGQVQLEVGGAGGGERLQAAADPLPDRRGGHVAQQVGCRAACLALQLQHGVMCQIVDARLNVAQLHAPQAPLRGVDAQCAAVEQQLALHLAEARPG
jgi:hypothetical protein